MTKIMIVDDETDFREALERFFKKRGFEVMVCIDGLAAVEKYKTEKPEITFLDLNIPELNGKQVFEQIRKNSPAAIVYFVSGSSDEIEKLKRDNISANGYLLKPLNLQDIVRLLDENR